MRDQDKPNQVDNVISKLDLDTIINPKSITSDTIVRYVRAMSSSRGSNMETLYNVIKGKVEAAGIHHQGRFAGD